MGMGIFYNRANQTHDEGHCSLVTACMCHNKIIKKAKHKKFAQFIITRLIEMFY